MALPVPNVDYLATGWWYVDFDPVGEPEARAPCPRRQPGVFPDLGGAHLAWMDEGLGLWVPKGENHIRQVGESGRGLYTEVVWYKFMYIPWVTRYWVISPMPPRWPTDRFVFATC